MHAFTHSFLFSGRLASPSACTWFGHMQTVRMLYSHHADIQKERFTDLTVITHYTRAHTADWREALYVIIAACM